MRPAIVKSTEGKYALANSKASLNSDQNSLANTTNKITAAVPSDVRRLISIAPKELSLYLKDPKRFKVDQVLTNQFKFNLLPPKFSFNTRGGWITPNGKWFLRSVSASYDAHIRSWLRDPQRYNNDIRLQAFNEGWIRQDWYQTIFSTRFVTNGDTYRKLSFAFDPTIALNDIRQYWGIQNIARAYAIIMPKGFFYELSVVKYTKDLQIKYENKRFKTLTGFLLELRNLRYGSADRLNRDQVFNNPTDTQGIN